MKEILVGVATALVLPKDAVEEVCQIVIGIIASIAIKVSSRSNKPWIKPIIRRIGGCIGSTTTIDLVQETEELFF